MRSILSHPICAEAPGWPGNPTYHLERYSGIAAGDCANTFVVHLFNHFGTHFDAPQHYNAAGPSISELPLDTFFYAAPLLLDLPKGAGEQVEPGDLAPYEAQLGRCDLLMIRTGFERWRTENPALYKENGPSLSSRAADYLRSRFTGTMKAVAMDFLSLGCPRNTEDGNKAHRIMLGCRAPGYICIIEDVSMAALDPARLRSAAAIPLFLRGADSSPVTMWADCGDAPTHA
jgi:arylformamidase